MPRKVIQLKGANGTGKTTTAKQLKGLSTDIRLLYSQDIMGGRKAYATLLADLGWILLGEYRDGAKMGGCDNIQHMEDIKQALLKVASDYPDHWIMFEGAMISTTMTMYNFMLESDMEPLIIILNSTMDGCLRRMEKRKGDGVKLTADMFTQLAPKLDRIPKQRHQPEHVRHMYVDDLSEEDMVYEFLAAVDWNPKP